jgi:hypothetical protein
VSSRESACVTGPTDRRSGRWRTGRGSRSARSAVSSVSWDVRRRRRAALRMKTTTRYFTLSDIHPSVHRCRLTPACTRQCLVELDVYGLGSARSLEEFQRHTGVNFKTRQIDNKAPTPSPPHHRVSSSSS